MDKPQTLRLQDGGKALTFTVDGIANGWQIKSNVRQQDIPFTHIWCSQQSLLHSSFILEPTTFPVQNLPQCTVVVGQLDCNNTQTLLMQGIPVSDVSSQRALRR